MDPGFKLKYQYRADFFKIAGNAWHNTISITPCKSMVILTPCRWSTGFPDLSEVSSSGVLKYLDKASSMIWAPKGGSVVNPRSSFLDMVILAKS